MNRTFRTIISVLVMLTVAVVLLAAPLSGSAASAHFTIIQPGDAQAQTGKTYEEWSVAWWQYALSLPNDESPLFDQTGATCRVGQAGSSSVFFLVGTLGGAVTRDECKVPASKVLFFPLFNAVGIPTVPGDTEENLRARLASYMKSTTELHASIDGEDVGLIDPATTPLRAISPAGTFPVTLPANNLFGIEPGLYPAVADGFYLMVAPLPPGRHTINFGGTTRNFTVDATYNFK